MPAACLSLPTSRAHCERSLRSSTSCLSISMEPRTLNAAVDGGRLVVRISSQMPTGERTAVADALGLDAAQVRVLVGDVGGGFGMKTGAYPEDIALAYAAWTLKRPVKWRADRIEEFLAAVHGRDVTSRAERSEEHTSELQS